MRLKKFLSPCAIGIVAVLFVSSCKEEEEIQKIKDVRYGEFVMDNEYGQRMFLSLNGMKIVPFNDIADEYSLENVTSKYSFDIAFAYYDPESIFEDEEYEYNFSKEFPYKSSFDYDSHPQSEWPKYYFAGATSVDLMRGTGIKFKKRVTTFYTLPKDFTTAKFDSLKTVTSILKVFESAKQIKNLVDKSSDVCFSDSTGWEEGKLIGLKTNEGKCGIIKILSLPYKYDRYNIGQIEIAVKFEGE